MSISWLRMACGWSGTCQGAFVAIATVSDEEGTLPREWLRDVDSAVRRRRCDGGRMLHGSE